MSPNDLLTKKDLEDFKQELFALLTPLAGQPAGSKWLKTKDVMQLLGVSAGTLHNLRINGTIPFNKVGSQYYYKSEDLEKILNGPEKKSLNKNS